MCHPTEGSRVGDKPLCKAAAAGGNLKIYLIDATRQ